MTGPGIYSYSTTPASNVNSNTGINWDEGMAPAAVNNSARQNMTDIRNAFNDLMWFRYGKGDLDYSPVYVASTQFKIAGADVTTAYHVGRRVKVVGSGTGTIYGKISASSFSTDTTVTCVFDSGSLSNETLTVYLSQVPVTGDPISFLALAGYIEQGSWTPSDQSGASLSFSNVSATYQRIGNIVIAQCYLTYPVTANTSQAIIGGLPITVANANYARQGFASLRGASAVAGVYCIPNGTTFAPCTNVGAAVQNDSMSGGTHSFTLIYPAA